MGAPVALLRSRLWCARLFRWPLIEGKHVHHDDVDQRYEDQQRPSAVVAGFRDDLPGGNHGQHGGDESKDRMRMHKSLLFSLCSPLERGLAYFSRASLAVDDHIHGGCGGRIRKGRGSFGRNLTPSPTCSRGGVGLG